MKQLFYVLLAVMISFSSGVRADNDKIIQSENLPKTAQNLIKTYFSDITISYTKEDKGIFESKEYKVMFSNGSKVEFDSTGNWKEVDCKYAEVPKGIVPEKIVNFITEKHPLQKIVQINRDKKDYELELDNGLDLVFDLNGNFLKYD